MRPMETSRTEGGPPTDALPWRTRVDRFLVHRAKTWLVIPLHIVAFVALYFASVHLLETGYKQATVESSRLLLTNALSEIPFVAPYVRSEREGAHLFFHLLVAHEPIRLRLYRDDGDGIARTTAVGPRERDEVTGFVASGEPDRFWLEATPDSFVWISAPPIS